MRDYVVIRQKVFYELLENYNKDKPKNEQIKLDYKDLVIFDYIAQFCLSDNEKIKQNKIVIDGKEYTHIAYRKIIEDNPFLDINARNKSQVIGTRINKLVKLGILEKKYLQSNGSKTYFRVSLLSDRGIIQKLEGVSSKNYRGYQFEMIGGITQKLYNREYNIDSNNRKKKIDFLPIYIDTLSSFEKKLLRIISNLSALFERYNLPVYEEKEYFKIYKKLLDKGYTNRQLLLAIYGRVEKVFTEDVDELKFLETLSNPKYFYKSISQLIIEAESKVKYYMDTYDKTRGEVEDELEFQFLAHCYPDYHKLKYKKFIDDYGYFTDIHENTYFSDELEYHLYLMRKFLLRHDIKLADMRYFLVSNATENVSYETLVKRFLFGLIYFEKEEKEKLNCYTSVKELTKLYNETLKEFPLNELEIENIIFELEDKLAVE